MHRVLETVVSPRERFSAFRKWNRLELVGSSGLFLAALCLTFGGWGSVSAKSNNRPSGASLDTTVGLFETRYRSAKVLSAVFLEQFRDNGKLIRREAGRAYFLHPGKMRWDYEVPEKNMFLVDGKYVWFYSPADHTATRMPTKKSEDWRTPLAFLASDMKLSRICSRIERAVDQLPASPKDLVYRCLLRDSSSAPGVGPSASSRPVLFELSPDGELGRIVIAQEGGEELEFSFKEWLWNPPLSKSWFAFTPPVGVVIVDGLLPDSPGLRQ